MISRIIATSLLLIATICVNAQSIIDIFSSYQYPKSSYTPGEKFPQKGYDLRQFTYGCSECSINRFPDVDTLFYIKAVKSGMKERTFYFMMLTESEVQIILDNALNKKVGKRLDRVKWMRSFFEKSELQNAERKNNPCWTFHKTRSGFSSDKYVVEGPVRGMGYKMLDYKTAQSEFYHQRGYDSNGNKISPEAQFSTWMLLLKVMGYKSQGKYYCNGLEFDNMADMEDYKNAHGLK